MYRRFTKPIIDFIVALFLLIIISPIIFVTAFFLFCANKGNILFYQQRLGLNKKPFVIIKFKTMIDAFDEEGLLLSDELRLTKVGSVVRSLSLDELPQLINVLKGEMSIVGPRPLLIQYLSRYSPEQDKRHNVNPGITGWAQVNGRNAISWNEKFILDVEYVKKQSFLFDLKILYKTFLSVIRRKGINSNNHSTMKEFLGNE